MTLAVGMAKEKSSHSLLVVGGTHLKYMLNNRGHLTRIPSELLTLELCNSFGK